MRVAVGVVTFNPNLERLSENLFEATKQSDWVYVFDNGSSNIAAVRALVERWPKASVVSNSENIGVAGALNRLMIIASRHGFPWVLTLDQDSVIQPGCIGRLASCVSEGARIGIVSPRVTDRNFRLTSERGPSSAVYEVPFCITSGSLTSVHAWEDVGGFDEALFIDFVDFDYCATLRGFGYRILRCNEAVLLHELGHSHVVRALGREIVVYNHDVDRKYYYARNATYCAVKHRALQAVTGQMWKLAKRVVVTVVFEDRRIEKLVASARGVAVGAAWALRLTWR